MQRVPVLFLDFLALFHGVLHAERRVDYSRPCHEGNENGQCWDERPCGLPGKRVEENAESAEFVPEKISASFALSAVKF